MVRVHFPKPLGRRPLAQKVFLAMVLLVGVGLVLLASVMVSAGAWVVLAPQPARGGEHEVWHTAPPDEPVSDDALARCTRRWLDTDGVAANAVIPFVILPLTLEWEDFRLFMCRVHARTRYLYIIQNGEVEEMSNVLRQLRQAVPSERLIIEHRPSNIGYAAAVNEGYRVALAKAAEEVPFVGVFNCDVYFERKYFDRFLPDVYQALSPDADRIRDLEEEVRAEEAVARLKEQTTLRDAASSIPGLSLSYLLPDRVRFATLDKQRSEFKQHVGMFHYHYQSMCAFLVSRLALLTGGFLDENCYPAYFEDYDWKFRMTNLGFRTLIAPSERYGGFYHGLGGNIRVINRGAAGRSVSYELEATRVSRMLVAKSGVEYGEAKWGWHREAHIQTSVNVFPHADFVVPVDAWILDAARLKVIVEIGKGVRPAVEMRNVYNVTLLDALRPFSRLAN